MYKRFSINKENHSNVISFRMSRAYLRIHIVITGKGMEILYNVLFVTTGFREG